jgi:hypothetical protein
VWRQTYLKGFGGVRIPTGWDVDGISKMTISSIVVCHTRECAHLKN